MNAPGAHYVANAGAKIQPFSVTSITFHCFLQNITLEQKKVIPFSNIYIQRARKQPFSRYFCVTLQSLATAQPQSMQYRYKQKKTRTAVPLRFLSY